MSGRIIPPPGAPRVLALAQLANSFGDGAYYVCSALYFTRVAGLSPEQVGFGLTLGWAAGFAAGVPLGHLADRRGPRGVAVLLAVATGAAVAGFLLAGSFGAFVVAACLYGCCQCGLAAARQALLAALVGPEERTRVRAYLQATVNAGLAVGAALGGLALYAGTREAYLAVFAMDAASFLVAALVLLRLPSVPPAPPAPPGEPALAVLRDRPYALVTLLNTVMLLYMPMLSLVVPLWIAQHTRAPGWTVSALLVLNTVGVVLFQVRMARGVTDLASAARSVRRAGATMLASCAVFALSAAVPSAWAAGAVLVVAACLQVVGEMMQAPGAWEIGFGLAPADRQGQYQGFFGAGTAVARMLGPLLLTTMVVGWGAPGWFALGGLFLLAGLATGPAVRWAERMRPIGPAGPAAVRLTGAGEIS
ncbi:MFS transporter [Streptosporangium pseudovulgare]|uniref:MFS transporter n=1 Tax=Streptosporangium pseudovulgare TaxID=35765 RepID=A0ABQ2R3M8_9ACTN|nr:MFS transporter [Streptosporangium pseudovulgare]GGQ11944.1 MFS transporter [Streptosporangium pseudovulgare]